MLEEVSIEPASADLLLFSDLFLLLLLNSFIFFNQPYGTIQFQPAAFSSGILLTSIAKPNKHSAEIKRTLQLAMPVVLGQVAVFSMSFVDTVMAGRLVDRQLALAGLGIGGAMWSALMVFTIGLLVTVQPSVAQLHGAGRHPEAAAVTRQAYWIAALAAIPFWAACFFSTPLLNLARVDPLIIPVAAGYLRAISWGAPAICFVFLLRFFSEGSGHTKPTMVYGILGALLNVPLNYIFMFGKFGFPASTR